MKPLFWHLLLVPCPCCQQTVPSVWDAALGERRLLPHGEPIRCPKRLWTYIPPQAEKEAK